jgi:predicted aspartyl protease
MKRRFSHAFAPPAPVVPVFLRAPGGQQSAALDGKIDTGADLCGVPEQLVIDLDLPPVRSVRVSGFAGAPHEVVVYRVDVEIEGLVFRRVEALAVTRPYVLVGRNVLRKLVVRLDGPREQLDLRRPRPGS